MGSRRHDQTLAQRHTLGARIRELRESRGISQEQLAHAAGLQRPVVGFLERAERDFGVS